jgi:hypothetical protein
MTRLEAICMAAPWAGGDVLRLREAISAPSHFPGGFLQRIWEQFSAEQFDAQYMNVDDETVAAFVKWCEENV